MTSLRSLPLRHCAWATQLHSTKCCGGGETLAALCPILPARDFEPQTSRSRDKRVTVWPSYRFNELNFLQIPHHQPPYFIKHHPVCRPIAVTYYRVTLRGCQNPRDSTVRIAMPERCACGPCESSGMACGHLYWRPAFFWKSAFDKKKMNHSSLRAS